MTKKDQIVSTGTQLFFKFGFKKISVDEICKKANVSRKTYYTYFKNKENLVLYIMKGLMDAEFAHYNSFLYDESISFAEKIERFIYIELEASKQWSLEFFADLMNEEDSELRVYYDNMLEEGISIVYNFLEYSQKKGDVDPALNLNYLIWLLRNQYDHWKDPEVLKMFPNVEELTRQMIHIILYGILAKPEK